MKRIEVRILAVACLLTLCSFANAASVLWPATWVGPGGSLADYFIAGGDGNNGTTAGIYVNRGSCKTPSLPDAAPTAPDTDKIAKQMRFVFQNTPPRK